MHAKSISNVLFITYTVVTPVLWTNLL